MKFIRRYTLIVTATLFTLTAMAVMLLFMANRDVEAESLYLYAGSEPDGKPLNDPEGEDENAGPGSGSSFEGYLRIPLEEGIGEEDVDITYNAESKTLSVTVPVKDSGFYYNNNLSGSSEHVSSIEFKDLKDKVVFDIKNDDKMALKTVFENDSLYISFKPLAELYDRIVVVDAGHGGEDSGTEAYEILEKDITLGVAKELESITGENAGVFFTRTGDEELTDEEREKKAEALGADIIISLHTDADKDTRITRGMQVIYNDDSVSDMVQKLAESFKKVSQVEDVSVKKTDDPAFFAGQDVPCIVIKLGYMTNKAEAEMMNDKEFQKQIAEAVASVIKDM